jgi:hypothetical protein
MTLFETAAHRDRDQRIRFDGTARPLRELLRFLGMRRGLLCELSFGRQRNDGDAGQLSVHGRHDGREL